MTRTTWEACRACGAMTRHDDGICIRNPQHPRYDARIPAALRGPTAQVAKDHHTRSES